MDIRESRMYTMPVIDVDGELGFELPDELMEILNLKPGDEILWIEDNGAWRLLKKVD